MTGGGFYLMHRGWTEHSIFRCEPYTEREAWEYLIANAHWRAGTIRYKGRRIDLARGQLAASSRDLADKWQWDESRIRRFLKRLKTDAMIDTSTDALVTVISISNYGRYQKIPERTDAPGDAPSDASSTHQRRTNDAQEKERKPRKTGKTGKTEKDSPAPSEQACAEDVRLAFDLWNNLATEIGLSVTQRLTKPRRSRIKARLRDCGGRDGWQAALQKVKESSFCRGGGKQGWRIDIDSLTRPETFTKLMEGTYDDRPGGSAGRGRDRGDDMLDEFVAGSTGTEIEG